MLLDAQTSILHETLLSIWYVWLPCTVGVFAFIIFVLWVLEEECLAEQIAFATIQPFKKRHPKRFQDAQDIRGQVVSAFTEDRPTSGESELGAGA